jgi:hypothetical protein
VIYRQPFVVCGKGKGTGDFSVNSQEDEEMSKRIFSLGFAVAFF